MIIKTMKRTIPVLMLAVQLIYGQDYQMRMSGFTAMSNNASYSEGWFDAGINLVGSLGLPVITNSTGSGYDLTSGFWVVTQGFYTQPPTVQEFVIIDDSLQVGLGVNVMAKFTDFNGIFNAKIFVNIGGTDTTLAFPMERGDSTFTAFIPDSVVKIENFIASAEVMDSLYYIAQSNFITAPVLFNEDEPSSRVDDSAYPKGLPNEKWRLVSFPGELDNGTLSNKGLNSKHVFYSRDWDNNKWFKPDTLYLGEAYWFKHQYGKKIDFTPGSGKSLPLTPYAMELFPGWNFVGNPFFFTVPISLDQGDLTGPITYGIVEISGWSEVVTEMQPWGGYLINNNTDTIQVINLIPTAVEVADNSSLNRVTAGPPPREAAVSYTHLTLPTNREV